MRFLDYCKETHGDSTAKVTVFDINPNMLEVGKERFTKTPYHNSTASTLLFFQFTPWYQHAETNQDRDEHRLT